MKRFAFISRHDISEKQERLAREKGIELIPVGDRDAFTVDPEEFQGFDGAIVVHPAAALRLCSARFEVGVFENANRAPASGKPLFEPVTLRVFRGAELLHPDFDHTREV